MTTTLLPEATSTSAPTPPAGPPRRRSKPSAVEDNPMRVVITKRSDLILIYALLGVMGLIFAFPLYAAVKKSLDGFGLQNYISLITEPIGDVSLPMTYLNSLIIGALHAALVVAVSSTAGYALSQLRFRGRELAFVGILLFLAVPGAALIIPVYHITNELNLFNNYLGVALPEAALTIPFGVLLMRNYGSNISESLIEAALLDGAGHVRVFWSVFLPLARPAIANLVVLCFIWSLQDFLWPSMLFTNPDVTTAAQAVSSFSNVLGRSPEDFGRYNASLVLLAVPAVLFVLFGLRFIVNGLTSGSTKD
ncbi:MULTISPECIES: carbohydrate ABC transporter permease [unclassified Rathayibacter]|uniref:carbohydrate ABC transporter permease n=1 Tax=unclassified Rathayibacter TaxID=2609250 RepID=UPI000F9BA578|nr:MULTISPECIES: carbohydrate ABC transporter permease [unclassified Rathayibacter]ROP49178.1 raffinose/stachyose/melibiose transport system permease protein [Rathayibacter sp. PhB186]ROS50705.1 raffinose/stachyose/melibiose transport system permease protein [Rathayibacter sp. PhB185]